MDGLKDHPLKHFTAAFVPLRVAELEAQGGPTEDDLARVKGYLPDFGSRGEALLYRIEGETGPMTGKLVDAVAVLAFQPGGITIFGQHFEGNGKVTKEEKPGMYYTPADVLGVFDGCMGSGGFLATMGNPPHGKEDDG
jgi:hypothetical protein